MRLTNTLRDGIQRGQYPADEPFPSERELCDSSGYSRTTVRRAVQALVDEGLLYRVPRSGTFVVGTSPNRSPQAALGLIVPTLVNPYFAELSQTIEREACAAGYQLLVGQSDYSAPGESGYLLRYADSAIVKGLLIVASSEEPPLAAYEYVARKGLPLIFPLRGAHGVEADLVTADHVAGARQMVHRLIELGHKRIAFIGGVYPRPSRHLEGYRLALCDAGLPVLSELVVSVENGADTSADEVGWQGVHELLRRAVPCTAIFARNDYTALGVLRALHDAGLRVPDDVSVVSFDNTQLSPHLQPPLTTVDPTPAEIGRLAVSFLLDRIERRYSGPKRTVIVQPSIVMRDSCVPASGEPRVLRARTAV